MRWLWGLPLLVLACQPGPADRPACSPDALLAIESAYIAEVMAACPGAVAPDQCPAYPALRAKYQAQRVAWEDCR